MKKLIILTMLLMILSVCALSAGVCFADETSTYYYVEKGKTECGAVEAVWWARGIHPYRQNRNNVSGWIVSLSYEVQRDVAQSKFLSYLNPDWIADIVMLSGKKGSAEYGVIDYVLVKNVLGGTSKVSFKSWSKKGLSAHSTC